MSLDKKPEIGSIAWLDLTIGNAEEIQEFYSKVVGWKPSPVNMGDYSDFNMNSPISNIPIAGVCHARGINASLPHYWMVYIIVEDVDKSSLNCQALGGKVITPPKEMGNYGRYAVIQDPAGAYMALFTPKELHE